MAIYVFECPMCHTQAEVIQSYYAVAPVCSTDTHSSVMDRLIAVPSRTVIKNGCTGAQRIG
jgi:hypothetical protein